MKLFFTHTVQTMAFFILIVFSYSTFAGKVPDTSSIYTKLNEVIALFMAGETIEGEPMGVNFTKEIKDEYDEYRPDFPVELDLHAEHFIAYLNRVGFFTYRERRFNSASEFAIEDWVNGIEGHGCFYLDVLKQGYQPDFFEQQLEENDDSRRSVQWIKNARKLGQLMPIWSICGSFGIKGKIVSDLKELDNGSPSNSIDRYQRLAREQMAN